MTRRPLPMLGPTGAGPTGAGPVGAGPTGLDKAAEADDPLELVGVPVPVDEATFDEMARCFVEEYVRDGWADDRLMALFRSPFYAGLHVIWRRRGEAWVRDLIAETRLRWRRPSRPGVPSRQTHPVEGPA